MVAERARHQHGIARLRVGAARIAPGGQGAEAGRGDEHAVALALFDDLGVAGHDVHAGRTRRGGHRIDDARQLREQEAFLEDEAGREPQRAGAHHREIVHRAMHRQAADVTAGEEQRAHHMAVGGHHQALADRGGRQHGAIVAAGERRVVEGAHEQVGDQLVHAAATGAVAEVDMALAKVERAGVGGLGGGHGEFCFRG